MEALLAGLIMKLTQDRLYYGENDQICYMCAVGSLKIWDPKIHWAVQAYLPFWTEEKEAEAWDFKGKAGNL